MKPNELKYAQILPMVRERLTSCSRNHEELDYARLFETCRYRALRLWNMRIAPELDVTQQRKFERALATVGMRAGLSIPWAFASGYAFGAACHAAAGGNLAHREDAAVICGLYMFFLGTFDHLLDEYPDEFAGLGEIINADTLERCALGRDLRVLECDPNRLLANGLLRLYQVYFRLCHRLLDRHPDPVLARTWLSALLELHRVEAESVDRRISKVVPRKELILHAQEPSTAAYWGLGVTALLGDGEVAARRIEAFSRDYGRLAWFADDASDIEKDIENDIWSGLLIKLAIGAGDNGGVERIVLEATDEAGMIVQGLYQELSNTYWETGDGFSLADILWAYIWAWVGGPVQAAAQESAAKPRQSSESCLSV